MARNFPHPIIARHEKLTAVPVVGGVTYIRTGILKWWLGGVLMGGAYMVCGSSYLIFRL